MTRNLMKAAVVAALVAPMAAQADVYGIADGVLKYTDDGATDAWDVTHDKLRWGLIGSEDLGNGMKANYRYEYQMGNAGLGSTAEQETTRLAFVGLSGDWGSFAIGRNWWPSYGAVWNTTDSFDAHATGASQNNLSGNRTGNQIQYVSPDMSGFQAFAAAVIATETDATAEDGIDIWEIGATYKNGPLMLGATYRNDQTTRTLYKAGTYGLTADIDNVDSDIWGIRGSYSFGDFKIDANYGSADWETNAGDGDSDHFGISFEATFDANQITVAYRKSDLDDGPEIDDWAINLRHFMSKTTRVFVEYRNTDDDMMADEVDMFAVGVRHDWRL